MIYLRFDYITIKVDERSYYFVFTLGRMLGKMEGKFI